MKSYFMRYYIEGIDTQYDDNWYNVYGDDDKDAVMKTILDLPNIESKIFHIEICDFKKQLNPLTYRVYVFDSDTGEFLRDILRESIIPGNIKVVDAIDYMVHDFIKQEQLFGYEQTIKRLFDVIGAGYSMGYKDGLNESQQNGDFYGRNDYNTLE
jgi:hypothetical protein